MPAATQRLCLPYERQVLLSGYKSAICLRLLGYLHCGLDIASRGDRTVCASGDGIVLAAGRDNMYGGALAVLYPHCADINGSAGSVVARYMHLRDVCVRTGESVTRAQPIAHEGAEGTGESHLHLELDADICCPCSTPQVGPGHTFWQAGGDTTVDPALWLTPAPGQLLLPTPVNPEWLGFSAAALQEKYGK